MFYSGYFKSLMPKYDVDFWVKLKMGIWINDPHVSLGFHDTQKI